MTEAIKQRSSTSAASLIIAQFIGPNTRKSAASILPPSPRYRSLGASCCRRHGDVAMIFIIRYSIFQNAFAILLHVLETFTLGYRIKVVISADYHRLWIQVPFLCSRPIGRITRLARPSVSPSVPYGLETGKQKKTQKNQNWYKHSPPHE